LVDCLSIGRLLQLSSLGCSVSTGQPSQLIFRAKALRSSSQAWPKWIGFGSYAKPKRFRSGNQITWVLLICQIQVNVDPTQFFEFKNNKTISKYQNVPYCNRNYTKNSVKQKKKPSYISLFFLSFPRSKMHFNYLTVCEMSKNLWATCLNSVSLGDRIIFLLCK
jgi:hypothetical protein